MFLLPASHLCLRDLWAQGAHIYVGWASVPEQSGTEERGLKHYWFTSWPDQKTPDRAPPLLHLVQEVEEAAQQEGPHCAPIIVHCRWVLLCPWGQGYLPGLWAAPPLTPPSPMALSAGIGRTGCFIATSICCQQLRHEGVVDILKTTCQLRQDRSAHGGVVAQGTGADDAQARATSR